MNNNKIIKLKNILKDVTKINNKFFSGNFEYPISDMHIMTKSQVYTDKTFTKIFKILGLHNKYSKLFMNILHSNYSTYTPPHTGSEDEQMDKQFNSIFEAKDAYKDSIYYFSELIPIIKNNAKEFFKDGNYDAVGDCGEALDEIHHYNIGSIRAMVTHRTKESYSRYIQFDGVNYIGGSANIYDLYACLYMLITCLENNITSPAKSFHKCAPALLKQDKIDDKLGDKNFDDYLKKHPLIK